MEINEINKQLYEAAFIENGEFGYHGGTWKPSINESEIHEWCEDDEGHGCPATPMGYRDYKESRIQGIKNILDQYSCVDLTEDKLHHLKKDNNIIKLYDKIKTDKGDYVVCGENETQYFVVDANNHAYFVEYED